MASWRLVWSPGPQEFLPTPEESRNLVRAYYQTPRNLLLRFKDDSIDDTNGLMALLQSSPNVGAVLDLSVRTLPGDHLRPLHQVRKGGRVPGPGQPTHACTRVHASAASQRCVRHVGSLSSASPLLLRTPQTPHVPWGVIRSAW